MKITRILTILLSLLLVTEGLTPAFAKTNPFSQYLPDITVTDVRQDGTSILVKVCNIGGAIDSSEDTLTIAIQKPRGGVFSIDTTTEPIISNSCYEYPVGTITEIGLNTLTGYNISVGALLKGGRDSNARNNRFVKNLYINTGKANIPPTTATTGTPYYNSNGQYCNSANNYCGANNSIYYNGTSTSYNNTNWYYNNTNCNYANSYCNNGSNYYYNLYCNYSNNYCGTNNSTYNNNNASCTAANNYCNNNSATSYNNCTYANNYCNSNSTYYNNTYSTTKITYPNGGENLTNSSNNQFTLMANIGISPQIVDHIDTSIYRNNGDLYRSDRYYQGSYTYGQGSFTLSRTFNTSDWADENYTATIIVYDKNGNVLAQDTTDSSFRAGRNYSSNYNNNYNYNYRPDLVVEQISQNSGGNKYIVARICNRGQNMNYATSIRTDFTANSTTVSSYNTIQLSQNQCIDTTAAVLPSDLGISSAGSYYITARTDVSSNVDESNENNNSYSSSLYIENYGNRPDLTVDRITMNDSNRTVTAHICNIGGDTNYNSWNIEFTNQSGGSSSINSGTRLRNGECTDSSVNYSSISIYRTGGYSIRVAVDQNNALTEESESNNIMTQYLQTWIGY